MRGRGWRGWFWLGLARTYSVLESVTVESGDAAASKTITLGHVQIKEVVAYVPTLDAGDASTISLRLLPFSSSSTAAIAAQAVTPNGWTDKGLTNTEDNDAVKLNASTISVYVDGAVYLDVLCGSAQAADRVVLVLIIYDA